MNTYFDNYDKQYLEYKFINNKNNYEDNPVIDEFIDGMEDVTVDRLDIYIKNFERCITLSMNEKNNNNEDEYSDNDNSYNSDDTCSMCGNNYQTKTIYYLMILLHFNAIDIVKKYYDEKYQHMPWYPFIKAYFDISSLVVISDYFGSMLGNEDGDTDYVVLTYYGKRNQITPYHFNKTEVFFEGCKSCCGHWPEKYIDIIGLEKYFELLEIDKSILPSEKYNELLYNIFNYHIPEYLKMFGLSKGETIVGLIVDPIGNNENMFNFKMYFLDFKQINKKPDWMKDVIEKFNITNFEDVSYELFITYCLSCKKDT